MIYLEVLPDKILRSCINCFWMIHAPESGILRDRTFPDGCQEVIFNVDTQVLRDDGKGYFANPSVELVGQMTRPYDIITDGRQTFFGIKFYPHSFSLFTRQSIHDLRDQSIDARELLPAGFNRVVDRVLARPDFPHFVRSMNEYFRQALLGLDRFSRTYWLVDRSVRQIFLGHTSSIESLAKALDVSERYLQVAFKTHVGLSPKQLGKMIRFQRVFQYLDDPGTPLADLALACDYYDQAHFTHSFKSLAGISPGEYRAMTTPLNRHFLNQTSYAYLCNYRLSSVR